MTIKAGQLIRDKGNRLGRLGLALYGAAMVLAVVALAWRKSWVWMPAMGAAFGLVFLEKVYIEKAIPWLRGAKGEQITGALLDELRGDGYHVFHGVRRGRGDVDHVVVGPTGVYVIDSKAWTTQPRVHKNSLYVGHYDASDVLDKLTGQAMFVKTLVREAGALWVEPILASTIKTPRGGCRRARGVSVLPSEDVVGFIRSRTSRLTSQQIATASRSLLNR